MAAYIDLKPHMDVVTHHTTVAGDFAVRRRSGLGDRPSASHGVSRCAAGRPRPGGAAGRRVAQPAAAGQHDACAGWNRDPPACARPIRL
jgi:hypothetical protein